MRNVWDQIWAEVHEKEQLGLLLCTVVKNPPAMQGTHVQSLVREDPTCRTATKPVRHNYWACALEPKSHNYGACTPQLPKPAYLEAVFRNKTSHRNEKHAHHNEE